MNASNSCGMRAAHHRKQRPLQPLNGSPRTIAFALALLFAAPQPTRADAGHDHGDAAPAATGTALPRFTAVSELFELVGILDGRQLTLYLDHAATNAPVKDAKLDVELGGVKLALEPHGDGEFIATLADAPKPGAIPVTAMVATAKDSDLLAGDLDLHDEHAAAPAAHVHGWREWLPWGMGGIALAALAVFVARRRRGSHPAAGGSA